MALEVRAEKAPLEIGRDGVVRVGQTRVTSESDHAADQGAADLLAGGMDSFFADAAAGRMPLQAKTNDPAILEAFESCAAKYDFAFAEFPEES